MRVNEIAAAIHKRMCEDSRFGYSWEERYGAFPETWVIDGKPYEIKVGDYDCSSSCITAWQLALSHTEHAGALEGATYTGNMRSVFVGSGLFEWKSMDFLAEPGDLYLNEANHVAMCQTQYPDILSEFSSNEYGGCYGGERGDQTGWESHVAGYYDYPWDGILHYIGDDGDEPKGKLYGIDVSSNQPASICSDVPLDFAIVKATGNPPGYDWWYVNPYAQQQADDAFASCGLVGLYHFTYGIGAYQEAELFVDRVEELGYLGKAMLVVDYEGPALGNGRDWVGELCACIERRAGYKPVLYCSGSAVVGQGLFELGYPIWVANYSLGYAPIYGYDDSACEIYGGCEGAAMWQFTSQGYLSGYDGPLDLDCFFGTREDFLALCGPHAEPQSAKHADGDKYHQPQGNAYNCGATAFIVGVNILLDRVVTDDNVKVWEELGGDTTTSRSLTVNANEWLAAHGIDTVESVKHQGGVWSTDEVKKELQQGNCMILSSNGKAVWKLADGSHIGPGVHQNGHWILFYCYKDGLYYANDSSEFAEKGAGCAYTEEELQAWLSVRRSGSGVILRLKNQPEPQPSEEPRYMASIDPDGEEWLPEMVGLYDTGGSGDDYAGIIGRPLRWIAASGVGRYRVSTEASGWLPWVEGYDTGDLENGCAGDGSPITAFQTEDETCRYAMHVLGNGWLADMVGTHDTGGSGDTFAGALVRSDAIRMQRETSTR